MVHLVANILYDFLQQLLVITGQKREQVRGPRFYTLGERRSDHSRRLFAARQPAHAVNDSKKANIRTADKDVLIVFPDQADIGGAAVLEREGKKL